MNLGLLKLHSVWIPHISKPTKELEFNVLVIFPLFQTRFIGNVFDCRPQKMKRELCLIASNKKEQRLTFNIRCKTMCPSAEAHRRRDSVAFCLHWRCQVQYWSNRARRVSDLRTFSSKQKKKWCTFRKPQCTPRNYGANMTLRIHMLQLQHLFWDPQEWLWPNNFSTVLIWIFATVDVQRTETRLTKLNFNDFERFRTKLWGCSNKFLVNVSLVCLNFSWTGSFEKECSSLILNISNYKTC